MLTPQCCIIIMTITWPEENSFPRCDPVPFLWVKGRASYIIISSSHTERAQTGGVRVCAQSAYACRAAAVGWEAGGAGGAKEVSTMRHLATYVSSWSSVGSLHHVIQVFSVH